MKEKGHVIHHPFLITEGYECRECHRIFSRRIEVHSQSNKYICCKCLGHKPLSCLDKRTVDKPKVEGLPAFG